MIGRFLLGAGLGGLVGTGVLALLSLALSGSFPQQKTATPPRPAEPAAEVTAPAPVTPEAGDRLDAAAATDATPVARDAGTGSAAEAGGASTGPAAEPAAEAPPEPAPEITAGPAPEIAGSDAAEDTPARLAALPEGGAVPVEPGAEILATAPDAPSAVADATTIAQDGEPVLSDAPQPPPLTAEEELMLAQLAADALLEDAVPAEGSPILPAGDDFVILDELPVQKPSPGLQPPAEPEIAVAPEAVPDAAQPDPPEPEDRPADMATEAAGDAVTADDGLIADIPAEADPPAGIAPEDDAPAKIITLEGGEALPGSAAPASRETGVETNRLPRIGDTVPGDGLAATVEAGDDEAGGESLVPREAFARAFENPANKPRFAVILIDDGAAGLDRQALADLPFAVSFAIDPQLPNAAEIAGLYRAAGQEVVMLTSGLPKGASASDVAVSFDAMAHALPEAVAAMDAPGRRFQADRPLSALVVPEINAQGRGVITWNVGLNAADQIAKREDVPSAVIFRNLDAEDEDAPVIRRYLDRAAFKAAQDGAVTVVGRATHGETIVALLEWAVEGRADSVVLAPASAMLVVD